MVHVLTDKDLRDSSNDNFLIGLEEMWGYGIKILSSIDGTDVLYIGNYFSNEDRALRTLRKPESVHQPIFDTITLETADPITDEERLRRGFVLSNLGIHFTDIVNSYPNSIVAGYAENSEEIQRLRQVGGIENALFLMPGFENQKGASRFIYARWFCFGDFRGILTTDNVDGLIAEAFRQFLVSRDLEFTGCPDCSRVRHYYFVQQHFLKRRGIKALYEFSPLAKIVSDDSQFPLMEKPGEVCTRWIPVTQAGDNKGMYYCKPEGRPQTEKVYRDFVERYRALLPSENK